MTLKIEGTGPVVGIVLGSDSDLPVMEEAVKVLRDFGVPFEIGVISAHRSPRRAVDYAATAEERGLQVIIAGAGMAAHLPGVLAACTCLPVIGVPLQGGALNGVTPCTPSSRCRPACRSESRRRAAA